jgi:hypothetical protein
VASTGDVTDAFRVLVEKSDRPLGRSWRRWKDNIKIVLEEVGLGDTPD